MLSSPALRFSPRHSLRCVGLVVGLFIAVNLVGELVRGPFDMLATFVGVPGPAWLRRVILAAVAAGLIASAALRDRPRLLRRVGVPLFAAIAALGLNDAAAFYVALARGTIQSVAVVPASLLVAAVFAALAVELASPSAPSPERMSHGRLAQYLAVGAVTAAAIPLVQMMTFGPTRYARQADCAVVLGARVWNDGTPSDALADRVDEAIGLYRQGLVRRLVMSGGLGRENGLSEPLVMKARAQAAGVPAEAILLDEAGFDTASTVRNSARLMEREGLGTALVVSHYYHEPRLKMLFDRAGIEVYTVPARMRRRLLKEPYFVVREIAAFYHSFLME